METNIKININDAIIKGLKSYLIDVVVRDESQICGKCELFEKINDEFALKKKYTLRISSELCKKRHIIESMCG